jgi:energy-coupling factor transporter ATP-binding protein EcfA2
MASKVERVKTYNTTMRQGPAGNYIEIEMKRLEEKYNFYSRMFTLVHAANSIDIESAWGWCFFDIEKIKRIIHEDKSILFAVLTVEVHMGKKKTTTTKYEKKVNGSKEDKFSGLVGYPHIHIVVYRVSDGKLETFNELHSKLRDETSFGKSSGDISIVGGEMDKSKHSRLKTSNIGLLSYTLKNSRHFESYDKLTKAYEKYKDRLTQYQDLTTDCTLLIDNSNDKEIIDFFRELNKKSIIVHIPEDKEEVEVKEKKPKAIHGKNGTRPITAAQEDLINSSVYVLKNMEKKGFRLCKDQIYVRKENTRRTWKKWGSVEKSIRELMTLDEPAMYALLSKNIDVLIKNATGEGQKIFPVVEINWFYIEFDDFFLHIPSCTIYKEIPEDIACGLHSPGITLANFLKDDMTPYLWLEILTNQTFSKDIQQMENFKRFYFSTLLPLIQKALVLCLIGVSNSGKSTLLEPLLRLFPKEVQTEITKGQFAYSSLPGKRLIILDDVKPEVLNSGNIKQLLEGGFKRITIEAKNVNATMDIFGGNICISTNMDGLPESWYECSQDSLILKTEYQVRLALYRFETPIRNPRPGFLQQMEDKEIGKVFIECSKSYARTTLSRNKGEEIIIMDTFNNGQSIRENTERLFTR